MNRTRIGFALLFALAVGVTVFTHQTPLAAAQQAPASQATIDSAQSAAVASLRTIATSQVTIHAVPEERRTNNGNRYGTMDELIQAGLLDPKRKGINSGYRLDIHLSVNKADFLAVAIPTELSGALIYTVGTDGVVRYGSGKSIGQPVK